MSRVDRRAVLSMIAAAAAGCSSAADPQAAEQGTARPAQPAETPKGTTAASGEILDTTIGRTGVLIRLEGLIAYSVARQRVKTGPARNVEMEAVDALLVDPRRRPNGSRSPVHRQFIGIPRSRIDKEKLPPRAVPAAIGSTHVYWPISGPITMTPSETRLSHIKFDVNDPAPGSRPDNDTWRSPGWIMNLDDIYSGYDLDPSGLPVASTITFEYGAEFEPHGLIYGTRDLASTTWELRRGSREGETVKDARHYKHSLHAFYEFPDNRNGLVISGVLGGKTPIIVKPGGAHALPIWIGNLPVFEPTPPEMEENEDAKVYAGAFKVKGTGARIPDHERVIPAKPKPSDRHDMCATCCAGARFMRPETGKA